jgi:hypothetical protein
MANQHQLLGAVGAIGESAEQPLLLRLEMGDLVGAIRVMAHFLYRASSALWVMFWHCLSGIINGMAKN